MGVLERQIGAAREVECQGTEKVASGGRGRKVCRGGGSAERGGGGGRGRGSLGAGPRGRAIRGGGRMRWRMLPVSSIGVPKLGMLRVHCVVGAVGGGARRGSIGPTSN